MNFLRRFTFTSSPLLRTFTTTRAIMSKLYVGLVSLPLCLCFLLSALSQSLSLCREKTLNEG